MIEASLARLASLHPKLIDLSLTRMEGLLAKFGNPHLSLPPTFHVAGTNGKGSTCAFLRSILEAAGKSVHVYSSPHLVTFNERFRLNGKIIDDTRLAAILDEVERVNAGEPITQFEITTIAGFLLFSRTPADFLVLEVGLGGRLDATNVIKQPLMSVITPVSIDHQEYLGHTLELIALEKAGIMKKGRPVVLAPQTALETLENAAHKMRAKPIIAGQEFHIKNEHGRLIYQDEQGLLDLPPPALLGDHQFINAGTAIAALRHSGLNISSQAIEAGILTVQWPARLQRLKGNLKSRIKSNDELWLDGGHNAAGGAALAQALIKMRPKKLVLLCGMINTKNPVDYLANFLPLNPEIHALAFDYPAALPPEKILQAAQELGLSAKISSLTNALKSENNTRFVICGSLYLAGEILHEDGLNLT